MRRTRRNLPYHELIGLRVKVKNHTDPGLRGLEGVVIDETMNTLKVRVKGKDVVVPKESAEFLFKLGKNESVELEGEEIVGRPEDRLRRIKR